MYKGAHMLASGYSPRFDAAESAFTILALAYVETELYEEPLPPKEGQLYVPWDTSAPAGSKSTRYRQITRTGVAQFISDDVDDLPTTGLFVQEFSHDFKEIGTSYQYTYMDMLSAGVALANKGPQGGPPINLDMELAIGAREDIERKLDRIAAIGSTDPNDPNLGLVGLMNLPNANLYVLAPSAATGQTAWSTKTPDEIIADLTGIVAAQVASTFKAFNPKRILLPILTHRSIAGRSMGDGRSDTILSYFVRTARESGQPIEVNSWQFCTATGIGAVDRMVAYDPNRRFVRHMISQQFTALPAQLRGTKYRVNCLASSAGVISPYPISVSYGDGL